MPSKLNSRDVHLTAVPSSIVAAELPYRLNRITPSYDHSPADSSNHAANLGSNNAPYAPYSQRIRFQNANLTGHSSEPKPGNDSSSEPSSSNTTGSSSAGSTSTGYTSYTPSEVRKSVILPSDATQFETLLVRHASDMPPPGLAYFEKRRALWYTPPEVPPAPPSPSPSRIKLEALLGQPGAVVSDEVWRAGLKNVWKGLVGGNMLRKRLPLDIVLKILQAGWLRDGTWPEGAVPPDWDEAPPPMPTPPPPPDPPTVSLGSLSLTNRELEERYKQELIRHAREQEAYDAAVLARQHAEHYAHAMGFGSGMGIPPGYSPSSGDMDQQGGYDQPYAYTDASPPPEENPNRMPEMFPAHEEADEDMDADGPDSGQPHVYAGDGRHEGG